MIHGQQNIKFTYMLPNLLYISSWLDRHTFHLALSMTTSILIMGFEVVTKRKECDILRKLSVCRRVGEYSISWHHFAPFSVL
jgi:hypothetical protein